MANIFYNPESRLSPVHYLCIRVVVAASLLLARPPTYLLKGRPVDLDTSVAFASTVIALVGAISLITGKWRRQLGLLAIIATAISSYWFVKRFNSRLPAGTVFIPDNRGIELLTNNMMVLESQALGFLVLPTRQALEIGVPIRKKSVSWLPIVCFFAQLAVLRYRMFTPILSSLDFLFSFSPKDQCPIIITFLTSIAFFLMIFRITRPLAFVTILCVLPVPIVWYLVNKGIPVHFGKSCLLQLVLFSLMFESSWFHARAPEPNGKHIVLYDGLCGLCNRLVSLVWIEDLSSIMYFSPLEGRTSQDVQSRHEELKGIDSVVYVRDFGLPQEEVFTRSDAVLSMLQDIGGFCRPVSWLRFLPKGLRDGIYNFVAQKRKRWFKPLDACPIPESELLERFLP